MQENITITFTSFPPPPQNQDQANPPQKLSPSVKTKIL